MFQFGILMAEPSSARASRRACADGRALLDHLRSLARMTVLRPAHPRAQRWGLRVLAACLAFQLCGCADSQPARALRIASASTSMTLCTAAFVTGIAPQRAFETEVAPGPGMRWLAWAVRYEVDPQRRAVRSWVGSRFESRAVHRPGLGCV